MNSRRIWLKTVLWLLVGILIPVTITRFLKGLGATKAYVGSYNAPAHALYASVGFGDYELSVPWEIVL